MACRRHRRPGLLANAPCSGTRENPAPRRSWSACRNTRAIRQRTTKRGSGSTAGAAPESRFAWLAEALIEDHGRIKAAARTFRIVRDDACPDIAETLVQLLRRLPRHGIEHEQPAPELSRLALERGHQGLGDAAPAEGLQHEQLLHLGPVPPVALGYGRELHRADELPVDVSAEQD